MDAIQVTMEIMKAANRMKIRPTEYWDNHCVNCGILKGMGHTRSDCPPQKWENKLSTYKQKGLPKQPPSSHCDGTSKHTTEVTSKEDK